MPGGSRQRNLVAERQLRVLRRRFRVDLDRDPREGWACLLDYRILGLAPTVAGAISEAYAWMLRLEGLGF